MAKLKWSSAHLNLTLELDNYEHEQLHLIRGISKNEPVAFYNGRQCR